MKDSIDADARALVEFEKMRLDLFWRHFEFHARQRTTLFHFFIILVPFLFGGCFILFRDKDALGPTPCVAAAIGSGLLTIVFYLLDQRNKQLYRVSKHALALFESQFLFSSHRGLRDGDADYLGVITTEQKLYGSTRILRHSFLMAAVYWIAIGLFGAAAVYFVQVHTGTLSTPSQSTQSNSIKDWTGIKKTK